MNQSPLDRLDSWKAIADYLQRDVRTVHRWEKTLALPIRRVPGSRGHSVFAYVSEIETWLKTTPPADAASEATEDVTADLPIDLAGPVDPVDNAASLPRRAPWRWPVAAAATVLVVTGLVWVGRGSVSDADTLTVHLTPSAVVAVGPGGTERWRYSFPASERTELGLSGNTPAWITSGKGTELLVAISSRVHVADNAVVSGQLLWLTPAGRLDRTLTLDDRIAFKGTAYGSPWALKDVRLDERSGTRRVALAAHHWVWWPGIVTILDDEGRRQGTFVNAGWIERVHWQSADRLIAAGFSNARDGGMIALLDANALDGQSPAPETSEFRCTSCGSGGPLRYVVFPRTEVNRASGSPFNRVVLQRGNDRLLVRTVEATGTDGAATDAIYEFSPSLDLLRASFSDRYWDAHRALEAQGKISHTRDQCPDRDGPRQIEVWEPRTGWKTLTIAHWLAGDSSGRRREGLVEKRLEQAAAFR